MFSCKVRQLQPTTIIPWKYFLFLEMYFTLIFFPQKVGVGGVGLGGGGLPPTARSLSELLFGGLSRLEIYIFHVVVSIFKSLGPT